MENKLKHLEFIQGVINRMAGNLFFLRGWTITLITGIFALSAKEMNQVYIFIAYFLIFIFWILDGYFLSQERLFRALYKHVSKLNEKDIDFSMNTSEFKKDAKNTWLSSMFSFTLLVFYLALLGATLLTSYFIN
jgi:hypothetical protein